MKQRIIPKTPLVLKKFKKYWEMYKLVEDEYKHSVAKIDAEMRKDFREETLEFKISVSCEGVVSLNNTVKPITTSELEKAK